MRLTGTAAADTIIGTAEDDLIQGVGGDDTLRGGDGAHLLEGGRGDDALEGDAGDDTASWSNAPGRGFGGFYGMWIDLAAGLAEAVTGVSGLGAWQRDPGLEQDTIAGVENATGSARNDFVGGDDVDNLLLGLAGADELQGYGGDDRLHAGLGQDRLFGGDGDDALFGSAGDNRLEGEAGSDALFGGAGADTLLGGPGEDRASGGEGDDRFHDADGAEDETASDRYDGGAGADTIDYSTAFTGIVAQLDATDGVVRQGAGETDLLLGIESITGSDGGDLLIGDGGANTLTGLGGDDRLFGRGGDDTLIVGSEFAAGASNNADGSVGDDALYGWGGSHDRLYGGTGADFLTGGAHALGEAPDRDVLDLGSDADADRVAYQFARSIAGVSGGGVDRVVAFDGAADTLAFDLRYADGTGRVAVADAGDFLDSDDNGLLNAADREVAEVAGNLVLDLGAVWARAFAAELPGDRPQQIVLAGTSDLGADRVAAPVLEPGWDRVGEADFMV